MDVAFGGLLVEAVELEAVGFGGARGARAGDAFDGVEGVDEDAVWMVGLYRQWGDSGDLEREREKRKGGGGHMPTESDMLGYG